MMVAHLAVERLAGANAIAAQHLYDALDADSVAVILHRPVAHVRNAGVLARYPFVEIAGHHVVEPEELDVRIDPQRDPGAARPGKLRAASDRDVGKRPVAAWGHAAMPLLCR